MNRREENLKALLAAAKDVIESSTYHRYGDVKVEQEKMCALEIAMHDVEADNS